MSHPNKRKGTRIENEMKDKFLKEGIEARRTPLSGAAEEYAGEAFAADVQVKWGEEMLKVEVKGRKGGAGFKTIEGWLGDKDFLLLKRNRRDPLCVMTWDTLIKLLKGELNVVAKFDEP